MSLNAAQINSFHMIAICCLANLGSKLADLERICDPNYKCLEDKVEYIRMLLSEICGYVPDGEEVLPYINLIGVAINAGDTVQILVDGDPIMNAYTFTGVVATDTAALINAIDSYGSGFTLVAEPGNISLAGYIATLYAPEGTGSEYSAVIVTATATGFLFIGGSMSTGIDATENNCIDYDDMETIIRRIQSELNICSSLSDLPETTLLTNPCGCC